jgi:hypothetical protein
MTFMLLSSDVSFGSSRRKRTRTSSISQPKPILDTKRWLSRIPVKTNTLLARNNDLRGNTNFYNTTNGDRTPRVSGQYMTHPSVATGAASENSLKFIIYENQCKKNLTSF